MFSSHLEQLFSVLQGAELTVWTQPHQAQGEGGAWGMAGSASQPARFTQQWHPRSSAGPTPSRTVVGLPGP